MYSTWLNFFPGQTRGPVLQPTKIVLSGASISDSRPSASLRTQRSGFHCMLSAPQKSGLVWQTWKLVCIYVFGGI